MIQGQMNHRSPEPTARQRPNFESTPLAAITASRAPSLKPPAPSEPGTSNLLQGTAEIADGEPCKNGGCQEVRITY